MEIERVDVEDVGVEGLKPQAHREPPSDSWLFASGHRRIERHTTPTALAPSHFFPSTSRNHGRRKEQEIVQRQEGFEEEDRPVREEGLVLSQGALHLQHPGVRTIHTTNSTGAHGGVANVSHSVGKTLVNRTTGIKNANDALKGRIFEVSLADLQKDEDHAFRKVKLRVDEVQGKNCLTNFHGLDFTSDKLRSLVRKWQSLIEANVVVKTTDDYLLRLFCIAFTKRRPNQIKKTTYAASSQIRSIRKKMVEIMAREASSCSLAQLTTKLIPEVIGREIEKSTQGIYPLQNVRRAMCHDTTCSGANSSLGPRSQGQAAQGSQVRSRQPPLPSRRVDHRRLRTEGGGCARVQGDSAGERLDACCCGRRGGSRSLRKQGGVDTDVDAASAHAWYFYVGCEQSAPLQRPLCEVSTRPFNCCACNLGWASTMNVRYSVTALDLHLYAPKITMRPGLVDTA